MRARARAGVTWSLVTTTLWRGEGKGEGEVRARVRISVRVRGRVRARVRARGDLEIGNHDALEE